MTERDALQAESHLLRAALAPFATRDAWLRSPGGTELLARLERHLSTVRRFTPDVLAPRTPYSGLHVAQWNVLHGERFPNILDTLRNDPNLAGADLIALEETDVGMGRSGNRDVAFELAAALGMHAAWTPLFLELESGYPVSTVAAAEPEREALFGLALLSRFPLGKLRRVPLESPVDLLFDRERKAGTFVALIAEVLRPGAPCTMVVTHLDVHGSPTSRLGQMRTLLDAVPPGPAIVAGDLNTTTFGRGGALRSMWTIATLAAARLATLHDRLLAPHRPANAPAEPLFAALSAAGFATEPFYVSKPSLDVSFKDVHELDRMPAAVRRVVLRLLRRAERRCAMRLDWIAARGFKPDPEHPPFVLPEKMRGPDAASDHAPVGCGMS